ncbi:MAG: hypothetical protein IPK69_08785 [Phycisphaerales bacterium]|nr:MAG: hypothetical protein IPK69_08785 [Phycisphaerales bacterium]
MELKDLNNDGSISDVDVSMMILDRMYEIYGQNLAIGDFDGDGIVNGEDTVAAIAKILESTFGKTTTDGEAVGGQDVTKIIDDVTSQLPSGDLNFDGQKDVDDIWITIDTIGVVVDDANPIGVASRELFTYIGAIVSLGRDYFMATTMAPDTHLEGVSSTWPADHPRWWPPNHTTGVSRSYDPNNPPDHQEYSSVHYPEHIKSVSATWPANHLKASSTTWPRPVEPAVHAVGTSYVDDPATHSTDESAKWPTSHTWSISHEWPADHDQTISRTWWPQHRVIDSNQQRWPPDHAGNISGMWTHVVAVSQQKWPPNHYPAISNGWSAGHTINISVYYPPGHLSYASNTWPGPQPLWPPGHTKKISESWGEPSPNEWPPLFPEGHDWLTTFRNIRDITPRLPWPLP